MKLVVILICAGLVGAACGGGISPQEEAARTIAAAFRGPTPTPCPASHLTLTRDVVRFSTQEEYWVPQRGEQFLIVRMQLDNPSDSPLAVSADSFHASDTSGRPYRQISVVDADKGLDATVNPHETIMGAVGFSVPLSVTQVALTYNDGCFQQSWVLP